MPDDANRFSDLFLQTTEGLLLSCSGGRILDANPAALSLYGYSRAELLGLTLQDLYDQQSQENCLRGEVATRYGLRIIANHRDRLGHVFPVTMQTWGLQIGERRRQLSLIVRNPLQRQLPPVAEQVKTAAGYALVQGKQVDEIISGFTMISQFATAGMLLLDASGTILAVNAAISAFLGYSRQELVGGHCLFPVFPEDFSRAAELFSSLVAGRIRSYEQEQRYLTNSGQIIWARVNATALVTDKDRRMLCVCQVADISGEKSRRDELRHYADLVQNADVAIYSFDREGRINSWNPAAERIYGYAEAEVKGRLVSMLRLDPQAPDAGHYLQRLLAGRPLQLEERHRRQDRRPIHVLLNLSQIKDECGAIVGISVLARDITEQKRLQQEIAQLDRFNLVGGIAASIGHEVRNPLTTVRGYLQLMLRRPELRQLAAQIGLMIEEIDRVNDMLSEFLALARNRPSEMAMHNLSNAVRTLMPLMEAEAALRGNEIVPNLAQLPEICVDLKGIRQLLLNLVRNGLEAMGSGGRLTIATYQSAGRVILEVADQGHGIPEEIRAKLGTAFFTTKESGTGLGLLTCYQIASEHNAELTFDSSPSGSTFRVQFRLPDVSEGGSLLEPAAGPAQSLTQ